VARFNDVHAFGYNSDRHGQKIGDCPFWGRGAVLKIDCSMFTVTVTVTSV